jgi:hypothetical protein
MRRVASSLLLLVPFGLSACSGASGDGSETSPSGLDAGRLGRTDAEAGGRDGGAGSDGGGGGKKDAAAALDSSSSLGDGALTVWSPSSAEPIHFHWFIGASTDSYVLSGQSGQVVYDIDGQGASTTDVANIHAAGATAVCYVDVGTLEQGRPDYDKFPASVIGPAVQGWPGENWLLVTAANQSTILPLMQARFQSWCLAKGFDAIEPDNLDSFTNLPSGTISEADNLTYDLAIAKLAHGMSLSIGLKNLLPDVSSSYVPSLLSSFDWALVEQCYEYDECSSYSQSGSFIMLGKAAWDVEYNQSPNCTQADSEHLNAQLTDLDLVDPLDTGYSYTPCVPDSQSTW